MKTLFFILISLSIYSCKKYDCECTGTYSSPPKGSQTFSSVQKINAFSKSEAKKTCKKYEDGITTCVIK
jgi:hypothetical protein